MAEVIQLANQLVWGVLVGISYSLLAIAFSLIFATSGTVNFATGEFAMLAAYFCYTILSKLNGQVLLAALLALLGLIRVRHARGALGFPTALQARPHPRY